jgi:putative Holliday junction resolvase
VGRILAIDYGRKRTGIAVSDPLQLIAGGLTTVDTKELERYVTDYMAREEVSCIVVGKPTTMGGAPSETMRFIQPLVERLRRAHPEVEVVLYDERFTSVLAHRAMIDGGLRKMARRDRGLVDKVAATIILEDYMASQSRV